MSDRAVEFPKTAVDDAILNAGERLVSIISMHRHSPYRNYFGDVTNTLVSGEHVPLVSATSKPRIGIIGDIRDAVSFKKLSAKEYQDVIGIENLFTLKQGPHWYYTDNVRIWHTRPGVVADIIVWDKEAQRELMNLSPDRGECPFPQDLQEAVVCGALSYLFRGTFNGDQVQMWRQYFNDKIQELAMMVAAPEVDARKIND